MGYLIGIDIGTSGCKGLLMDHDGTVVKEAAREYVPRTPAPGWSEQDPEDWFRAASAVIRELTTNLSTSGMPIDAVGLTGQMRGITLIGDDGLTVRPAILWNDSRCHTEVEDITAQHGDLVRRITKNPLNTMCTLPKLLWLMNNEPETWERTNVFVYPKDYIAFRLTGSLSTDPSDASGSSLFDPAAGSWSDELLELFSIPASKLPRVRASTDVSGHVTEKAARETGLPSGTPVIVGGSDAVTEMFSSGVVDGTGAKLRLGTSGAVSTITSNLSDIPEHSPVYIWAFVEGRTWMLDINTRSCAQSTAWLRDILFDDGQDSTNAFIEMARMAETVPVGSDGLFFHPYLMGEDAPYWDHRLTASFFGLNVSHTRSHLVRAVYEGTAFALADAKSALGTIADTFTAYHLIGGGTKNRTWTGIVLDVLGVDGVLIPDASAAKGAALLAGVGAEVFSSLSDAARRCVTGKEEISHNRGNHTRYIDLFKQYKMLKKMFDHTYEPTSN